MRHFYFFFIFTSVIFILYFSAKDDRINTLDLSSENVNSYVLTDEFSEASLNKSNGKVEINCIKKGDEFSFVGVGFEQNKLAEFNFHLYTVVNFQIKAQKKCNVNICLTSGTNDKSAPLNYSFWVEPGLDTYSCPLRDFYIPQWWLRDHSSDLNSKPELHTINTLQIIPDLEQSEAFEIDTVFLTNSDLLVSTIIPLVFVLFFVIYFLVFLLKRKIRFFEMLLKALNSRLLLISFPLVIFLFCLFFHIVSYRGSVIILAKQSPTFSFTFVKEYDISKIVYDFNFANKSVQHIIKSSSLHKALYDAEIILNRRK